MFPPSLRADDDVGNWPLRNPPPRFPRGAGHAVLADGSHWGRAVGEVGRPGVHLHLQPGPWTGNRSWPLGRSVNYLGSSHRIKSRNRVSHFIFENVWHHNHKGNPPNQGIRLRVNSVSTSNNILVRNIDWDVRQHWHVCTVSNPVKLLGSQALRVSVIYFG